MMWAIDLPRLPSGTQGKSTSSDLFQCLGVLLISIRGSVKGAGTLISDVTYWTFTRLLISHSLEYRITSPLSIAAFMV